MTTIPSIRDRIKELRRVPASELRANPKNWRQHPKAQQAAMAGVLAEIGYADALIARETPAGLELIDGHLRAETTPDQVVPVLVLDVTEEEADKILLTLDPLAAMASTDRDNLEALLRSVQTEDAGVQAMLEALGRENHIRVGSEGLTEPNAVPPLPDEPTSKPGDLWVLGDHRLICGDATDWRAVQALMAGKQASCMWTDPPYGVEYVGKTADALRISNDGEGGLAELLQASLRYADAVLAAGAPFYICHPSGPLSLVFGNAIREADWKIHETLVWVKQSMVLGHGDYHYRHEPLYYGGRADEVLPWPQGLLEEVASAEAMHYGWTPGARHPWYGRRSETSVFLIDRPSASREHPTMKPVELVERCLLNSTLPGGSVYEPFAGSGSTLIACERLGRRCYALEIDPRYVDVAVRRWEEYTGQTAVRTEVPQEMFRDG